MNSIHKRKGIVSLILTAACILGATGCGQQQTAEDIRRDFKAEAEAVYTSCASTNDCYLCYGMQEYEGQDTRAMAQADVFAYIEGFYNSLRPHSGLDWLSPMRFEANLFSSAA